MRKDVGEEEVRRDKYGRREEGCHDVSRKFVRLTRQQETLV
jgi:hypothetical protein